MGQEEKILKHLQDGRSITSLEALELYGCFRLASRISNLKKTHPNIERTMVRNNGKKFASYKMRIKQDLFK